MASKTVGLLVIAGVLSILPLQSVIFHPSDPNWDISRNSGISTYVSLLIMVLICSLMAMHLLKAQSMARLDIFLAILVSALIGFHSLYAVAMALFGIVYTPLSILYWVLGCIIPFVLTYYAAHLLLSKWLGHEKGESKKAAIITGILCHYVIVIILQSYIIHPWLFPVQWMPGPAASALGGL